MNNNDNTNDKFSHRIKMMVIIIIKITIAKTCDNKYKTIIMMIMKTTYELPELCLPREKFYYSSHLPVAVRNAIYGSPTLQTHKHDSRRKIQSLL